MLIVKLGSGFICLSIHICNVSLYGLFLNPYFSGALVLRQLSLDVSVKILSSHTFFFFPLRVGRC